MGVVAAAHVEPLSKARRALDAIEGRVVALLIKYPSQVSEMQFCRAVSSPRVRS